MTMSRTPSPSTSQTTTLARPAGVAVSVMVMSGSSVLMSVVRVSGPSIPGGRSVSFSAIDARPPGGSGSGAGLSSPAINAVALYANA